MTLEELLNGNTEDENFNKKMEKECNVNYLMERNGEKIKLDRKTYDYVVHLDETIKNSLGIIKYITEYSKTEYPERLEIIELYDLDPFIVNEIDYIMDEIEEIETKEEMIFDIINYEALISKGAQRQINEILSEY